MDEALKLRIQVKWLQIVQQCERDEVQKMLATRVVIVGYGLWLMV